MSEENKPKHRTFEVVEEYNVQVTFEVEVPVVYDDDEPLVFIKGKDKNYYVPPEDVVKDYKHEKVDEDWEFLGTLETKDITNG